MTDEEIILSYWKRGRERMIPRLLDVPVWREAVWPDYSTMKMAEGMDPADFQARVAEFTIKNGIVSGSLGDEKIVLEDIR